MNRSSRSLLSTSVRGLLKTPASIAPFATSQTQRPATYAASRGRLPSTLSSTQLVPLIQRAQFAVKPGPDVKLEKEVAQKKLESHPEQVTSQSSVRSTYEGPQVRSGNESTTEGVKQDVNRLVDTLALKSVPPIVYKLGLAGTLPYLGTSLSTVYLVWDLNTIWPSQSQVVNHFLISHETAAHYLHLLEPIQVSYGALILSFLGAIHWGLEFAEKQPDLARAKFRYGLGVLAPVVAWPTVLMPVHYALITQFAAFTLLYFADARATARAWTPTWYTTYRFVLTSIVGISIFISLIGREKIGPDQPHLSGLREAFHKTGHDPLQDRKLEKLEDEEREKNHRIKEEQEKKQKEEEEKKKEEEAAKNQKEDKKSKEGNKKDDKDKSQAKSDDGKDTGGDSKKGDKKDDKKNDKKDDKKDEKKDDKEDKNDDKNDDKKGEKKAKTE